MLLFMAAFYYLPNADLHFPVIEIETPQHLGLTYVNFGSLKIADCEASRKKTFDAVMKACRDCRVARNGCFPPDDDMKKVIGLKPIPHYSISSSGGYIVFGGGDPGALKEVCHQTAEALQKIPVPAVCYAPGENRLPKSGSPF